MTAPGTLYTITGPSGVGKTSLVNALVQSVPDLRLSISYTTRPPRDGERNGHDYHFVGDDQFQKMYDNGEFIECAEVFGHRYGTAQRWVKDVLLRECHDVILEIDWQGAKSIRERMPGSQGIYILPPSVEKLKQRLVRRKQDSAEAIRQRLSRAQHEMKYHVYSQYLMVNDNFETTLNHLQDIFLNSTGRDTLRTSVQTKKYTKLIDALITQTA